jgi:SAM-dependent methyltransferase
VVRSVRTSPSRCSRGVDILANTTLIQNAQDVSYRSSETAMSSLEAELRALIRSGCRRVCDVGGGANPVASVAEIQHFGIEYTVLDASQQELRKAPPQYDTLAIDIENRASVERLVTERGPFDVVVSRWTAEHVAQGRRFHQHVHRLLRPNGTAVHLFPTLYSPVFFVNRLLPRAASASIVPHVDQSGREREGPHESFRPYYSWCRGPTRRQLDRLASIGFAVRRYIGFFGHPYYARVKPIQVVHEALSRWLMGHPVPALTSYALVVLEREGDDPIPSPSACERTMDSVTSAPHDSVERSPSPSIATTDTFDAGNAVQDLRGARHHCRGVVTVVPTEPPDAREPRVTSEP